MNIAPAFLLGYFNVMPASIFFGLLFGLIVIGMWRRNRGIRLVSIVMIILSPLIMMSNTGLMFGIPLAEQALGQALLAAGISGVLLSFIKK
jgi:membrane protein CcdC involved in cytochrome C biogenesis